LSFRDAVSILSYFPHSINFLWLYNKIDDWYFPVVSDEETSLILALVSTSVKDSPRMRCRRIFGHWPNQQLQPC